MSLLGRARLMRREPLFRSSLALIVNTFLNGVLGFVYWVLAARLYPAATVGEGAGFISAMLLVSSIGWIGLQHLLMRFLPVAGSRSARVIGLVYFGALGAALPASFVFLAYAATTRTLPSVSGQALGSLAFVGAIVVWVVFSLQDAALIGLRRAVWVPVENGLFGVAKIAVLVALVATASPWVFLGSWVVPAAFLVIVINSLLVRWVLPARRDEPALPPRWRIAQFAAGQHAAALVAAAPDSVVPLMILAILGREANAFYYVAWTVSFSLRLVAVNIGSALTVEGSASSAQLRHLIGPLRTFVVALFVPIILAVWLGAGLILSVFGGSYSAESAGLLRLFALGLAPFTAVTLFVAAERVHQRSMTALGIVSVATALTIGLDLLLLPSSGILGAGIGWLTAQSTSLALAVAVVLWRRRQAQRHGTVPGTSGVGAE